MSFGGWLIPWRYLKQHGIDPFKDFATLEFLGQHDRVIKAVQEGLADAGSIQTGILERLASEGKINFIDFEVIDPQPLDQAVFYGISDSPLDGPAFPYVRTTPLYPQWALAKVYHVDSELAEKVMFAFMQITPSDRAALASHSQGWTVPLDYFAVHECLQDLKVGAYRYLNAPVTLKQLYQKYRLWVQGLLGLLAVILGGSIYGFFLNRKLKFTMVRLSHEHKEKERTVATLNEFKTTLDKTNDCVFIFDPETLLFLYANQGGLEQVGYSMEEILKMKPTDIKPEFTEPQFRTLIAPLLDTTKNSIEFITNHKTKNGELIPVEVMLQYVSLPNGKGRCVAIVRNITRRLSERREREKLQTRLLNEQKLASVGQLAAGIAHEINTPTQYLGSNIAFLDDAFKEIDTLITGYDQVLTPNADQLPSDALGRMAAIKDQIDWGYLKEEIPKAISQSLEGITKISSIVLAMKEFSHPGGKEKQLTDLNRLLDTTLTIARNEWKYVAEIDKDLDQNLPPALCLPNEIGQVFLNILVNAAHAIAEKISAHPEGEKGRITITSRAMADHIEITFTDTGCGIPEKVGTKVFDPFFTTKEVGRGTGQGLTISYDVIVKKHGGTIDFTSEEGKGTTFTIRLPLGSAI
jgi:PAS domain S-box-containing protein